MYVPPPLNLILLSSKISPFRKKRNLAPLKDFLKRRIFYFGLRPQHRSRQRSWRDRHTIGWIQINPPVPKRDDVNTQNPNNDSEQNRKRAS